MRFYLAPSDIASENVFVFQFPALLSMHSGSFIFTLRFGYNLFAQPNLYTGATGRQRCAEVYEMPDEVIPEGFTSLIEKIKKWTAPFIGVATFIFGLNKAIEEVQKNVVWSVAAAVSVGWLFLYWVYTCKKEREIGDGLNSQTKTEKTHQFPRWRRWALIGMIGLPFFTASGFAIADYIEKRPSDKTIILIANLEGPDDEYKVTQRVVNRMRRAIEGFKEASVKPLGQTVYEHTDIEEVRKIGAKHKASVIVWGFYDKALSGTIHIDQVRRTSSFTLPRNELDFNLALLEGRGIKAQEALSGEMNLLALLVIGAARYDAKDYNGAIERFRKALAQPLNLEPNSEVLDIKFLLGKSLFSIIQYREAIEQLQEVVSKRSDQPEALAWLGTALQKTARYTEAEPLFVRALEIREKTLGNNHPDTSTALDNLAGLYRDQGKYAEAEQLYKQALEIREKLLGNEHPDTAQSLNNLANLCMTQGKYPEAEPLIVRALEIRERALGNEHPDTSQSLNSLASLCTRQGRYPEAEPLYKRSLEIRERTLGKEHPDTAASLSNLAGLFDDQGKYAEAEPLYKRALEIFEKTLGKEHPDTAASLNNLAEIYKVQGRYAEAEPLHKRSLEIREKKLGKEHPYTALALHNLAGLYSEQGKYTEAEPLAIRALEIYEKTLGKEHPNTASSLGNLGALYHMQGKYAEAGPLYKRALEIVEKTLPGEHPYTALALCNLAELYGDQGKYTEAEPLAIRALEIHEKTLGKEHSDTATSLNNLAVLYHKQGKYAEAEPLYKRALEIREKTLGKGHPETVATFRAYTDLLKNHKGSFDKLKALTQSVNRKGVK